MGSGGGGGVCGFRWGGGMWIEVGGMWVEVGGGGGWVQVGGGVCGFRWERVYVGSGGRGESSTESFCNLSLGFEMD